MCDYFGIEKLQSIIQPFIEACTAENTDDILFSVYIKGGQLAFACGIGLTGFQAHGIGTVVLILGVDEEIGVEPLFFLAQKQG